MCIAIMNEISEYMISNIHINYNVVDLEDENCYFPKKKSSITPALWVDNKMWYAGVFDINKFDKKLNQMIN